MVGLELCLSTVPDIHFYSVSCYLLFNTVYLYVDVGEEGWI